jgi:hypothetical protein
LKEEHRLRVLRRIFGGDRRLKQTPQCGLYSSQNIIRIIKSRSVTWERHVVCVGEI